MKKLQMSIWKSLNYTSIIQNSIITTLLAIWLPLPFINFDEHHDGLILSTIRLTKSALIQGGEYPFNQYGPFWIIPFVLLSLIVPNEFLFLGVRFLTVFFYIISAFLLWKISRLLLNQKLSKIVVILFLGSQPFTTDYGSSLVPWPSAIVMPIALAITYFSLLQVVELKSKHQISMFPVYVGFLLPSIILTRLQVGIVLVVAAVISMYFSEVKFKYIKLLTGFVVSTSLMVIYLIQFGWLKDAFYDQIIFGSTYLSSDKSTFPKPIFTFIGIMIFFMILLSGQTVIDKILINRPKVMLLVIAFAIFISSTLVFYLIYSRNISPLAALVVMTRRFWITSSLSVNLFLSTKIIRSEIKNWQGYNSLARIPNSIKLLLLFTLSLQIQVYPLFDQMHFWWGSPLTFLVMVIVIKDNFRTTSAKVKDKLSLTALGIFLLMFAVLVPWTAQLTSQKEKLPNEIGQHIYSSSQNAQYQKSLQNFFHQNIPKGSTVLNICDNTNIFFESDQYVTANRIFVFWGEQMSHAPGMYRSFLDSNPEFILTCGLTHAPKLRLEQEKMQRLILEKMVGKFEDPISYSDIPNKIWDIYKVSK